MSLNLNSCSVKSNATDEWSIMHSRYFLYKNTNKNKKSDIHSYLVRLSCDHVTPHVLLKSFGVTVRVIIDKHSRFPKYLQSLHMIGDDSSRRGLSQLEYCTLFIKDSSWLACNLRSAFSSQVSGNTFLVFLTTTGWKKSQNYFMWYNSTINCALLLRIPTMSVRNPVPLRGTEELLRQNPSLCDVRGVMKQTSLLPLKTASRLIRIVKLAPLSCARGTVPSWTWPWPTSWWKNGSLLTIVLPPRPSRRPSVRDDDGQQLWVRPLLLSSNCTEDDAPGRADPSQWSGLTSVVSTASCAPSNNESPSATTSNRLPSAPWEKQV